MTSTEQQKKLITQLIFTFIHQVFHSGSFHLGRINLIGFSAVKEMGALFFVAFNQISEGYSLCRNAQFPLCKPAVQYTHTHNELLTDL